MHMIKPIFLRASRFASMTVLAAAATGLSLGAQQSVGAASVVNSAATEVYPTLNLQADLKMPASLFNLDAVSSSSSSSDTADAIPSDPFTMSDSLQPPPRRRYGRPHYTDNQHNADGSNKYAFVVGGGFTLPTGGTHSDLSTSYSFQGGVGRNFNKNFGVIAQFDWDNFGIQTGTLNTLLNTYNQLGATDQNGDSLTQLNGSSHIWSFTLNPVYYFAGGEKSGAYVIAGAGFYHKTANFTIPEIGEEDYYGEIIEYQANASIDKYTSNAFGVNSGVGFTYKPSRFGNQKFYGEARYVFVDNSAKPYSAGSSTSTYFNVFPQNSARTTYIPIKFGLRF